MPVKFAKNAEETAEILGDRKALKELLTDEDGLTNWVEGSMKLRIDTDPEVKAQVEAQAHRAMLQFVRDGQGDTDAIAKRLNLENVYNRDGSKVRKNLIYNNKALGAKHDDKFGDLTDFARSITDAVHKDTELSKKITELKNDLSSVKPSDGGYLIPEILRSEILRVAHERGIVRGRARVIPMDSLTVPFPMVDETSHVSSIYGGITGFWTEEGATLTETQPRFGQMELRAHKLTLYTEVPNELLRDAIPALRAFLEEVFPEALAWFEDVAFFLGGGVGEPLGFLNAGATVPVDRVGSSTDTIVWADIVAMYARMLPGSLDRAVWVVSPDVLPQLLTMTVGSGNAAVWMGGGNFPSGANRPPMTMLGAPIVVSEKARTLGTPGDITFVDFGYYLLGDRQAMSAKQSEDYKFQNDVTAMRWIERVDGRPWIESAITPQNGGATLSPFVTAAN
jgi:HK97 family phage major capsid protein